MTIYLRRGLALALSFVLLGCASLPSDRGRSQVQALVHERGLPAVGADAGDAGLEALLAEPLDAHAAVRIAVANSPRLHREYGRLGLAWAELFEASRLPNPGFGYAYRRFDEGGREITRSLSLDLADLLLIHSRSRLGKAEFERERMEIAGDILAIALDVEAGWYRYVGARQVADLRAAVARAAALSAELASRFHAAGNITELQLRQEQAAASQARIEAARAAVDATRQRYRLNAAMGLSGNRADGWQAADRLPLPVAEEDDPQALLAMAREARLDLLAARAEAARLGDAEAVVRRWRWLGGAEIGFEQERETGGQRLQGPEIALELPIFQQGQGKVARAEALHERSQAALMQLEIEVEGQVLAAAEKVRTMRTVAETYREALVPQREAIVAREQERYNFMLVGAFELIQAKREEFDAYEGYLESIRDYWLARVGLTRAVGTRLPSETQIPGLTPSTQEIVAPAAPVDHTGHGGMDHSRHEEMDHSRHEEMDHSRHEEMDHSRHEEMDHSRHEEMDHSRHEEMDHSRHEEMDHSRHEELDHSSHRKASPAHPHAHGDDAQPLHHGDQS